MELNYIQYIYCIYIQLQYPNDNIRVKLNQLSINADKIKAD